MCKKSTLKEKRLWYSTWIIIADVEQTEIVDAREFYEAEDYHQVS